MVAESLEGRTAVPAKNPRVVVYLPEYLKVELERLALVERRSVSSMTLVLIEQAIVQAKKDGKI